MSDRNKYSPNKHTPAEREEQKIQALKLWMTGQGYEAIGQAIGVSTATAWTRVQKALDDMRPHADYDHFRAIQLAEVEMMRRPMRKVIISYGTDGKKKPADRLTLDDCIKAISSLCRIQEREAKLLGLDKVTSPFDDVTGMSMQDLENEVAQWADELSAAA